MKEMIVNDIMDTNFAKISADIPVVVASMELITKAALGGPVVDANDKLLGWISEQECLQVSMQVAYYNERVAMVKDIMREDVLSVKAGEKVLEIATKMSMSQPKNYPVVDASNKVIGVITRRNVLKAILSTIE